jgi:hypothetical protein
VSKLSAIEGCAPFAHCCTPTSAGAASAIGSTGQRRHVIRLPSPSASTSADGAAAPGVRTTPGPPRGAICGYVTARGPRRQGLKEGRGGLAWAASV